MYYTKVVRFAGVNSNEPVRLYGYLSFIGVSDDIKECSPLIVPRIDSATKFVSAEEAEGVFNDVKEDLFSNNSVYDFSDLRNLGVQIIKVETISTLRI